MVDKTVLTIQVSEEERAQIEALAQARGYDAPEAYLLALVRFDAAARAEVIDLETKSGLIDGLRQSWREMNAGLGRPLAELWDELENDE